MSVLHIRVVACLALALECLAAVLAGARLAAASPASAQSPRAPETRARSLDLEPAQLDGLRIDRVATHSFPVDKQAVGSISFDEDPAIVQAESILLTASANLDVNSKELRRVRSLGENNGIAQKELEQALANEQSAAAALKAARDALRALGKPDSEIGGLIARGVIPDAAESRRAWALANVSESDSVSVRPGQPLSITVMAYPGRTFAGKVSRVYRAVDAATHRVAVRATITDPQRELRPGMLAEFSIHVSPAVQSLAIPANGAVRQADGTTSVWVSVDSRHFEERTVKTGARDAAWVQVVDGLGPGERIVTDGAVFLSNMLEAPPSD